MTIRLTDGLNNAHMLRSRLFNQNSASGVVNDGGIIAIGSYTDFEFTIPNGENWVVRFFVSSYDNSHPDWSDSVYDNGSLVKWTNLSGNWDIPVSSLADGTILQGTVTSDSGTYTVVE